MRALARGLALAASIGVNFGVLVSFGALAGRQLDESRGGSLFTVLGVALGAVAAFVNLLQILAWFQRTEEPGGPGDGTRR
jgi:peptidoglycan biosynthesis protein MviN/MurJ (putative lipid II flippase)